MINRYGVMFSLISQNGLALERTFRYCIVIEVLIWDPRRMADFWSFFVLNYWPVPKWLPWSADTSPRRSRHISIWTNKNFFKEWYLSCLTISLSYINGHLSYINHGHLPIMVIHLGYTMVIPIIYKSPGLGSQVVRSPALGPWGLHVFA